MIVIIGCGKAKLSHRARADELYTGPVFRAHLRFAEALRARALFILSAEHGLIARDTELDPYQRDLRELSPAQRHRWTLDLVEAVEALAEPSELVVLLAGADYARWTSAANVRVWQPLAGLQVGERRQVVGALTRSSTVLFEVLDDLGDRDPERARHHAAERILAELNPALAECQRCGDELWSTTATCPGSHPADSCGGELRTVLPVRRYNDLRDRLEDLERRQGFACENPCGGCCACDLATEEGGI